MVNQHCPALPSPPPQLLRLVTLKPSLQLVLAHGKHGAAFRGLIWSKGARELLHPFMRGGWMVSVKPSSCFCRLCRCCCCCCSSVWKKSRMCQNKHGVEVRLVREAEPLSKRLPVAFHWLVLFLELPARITLFQSPTVQSTSKKVFGRWETQVTCTRFL